MNIRTIYDPYRLQINRHGTRPGAPRLLTGAMHIRPATPADAAAILAIVMPVIRAGATYALDRDMEDAAALGYWMGADRETFVAVGDGGAVLGTYYLRANQAGGGRHVANCGYMTAQAAAGRGVAWRARCARIRSTMRDRAAFARCSSISW